MPMLPHNLCFLLFDGFSNMVLASAVEPLRAARDLSGKRLFSWQLASLDGSAVKSSSRISMNVDMALANVRATDALIVISGYGVRDHVRRETLSQLRQASRIIPLIGGYDTGAWLLAEAGLLGGHRATIHWMEEEAFVETFLEVEAVQDPYVVDENRVTCAGADAVLAYTLHLIGERADLALRFDVANMFGKVDNSESGAFSDSGMGLISSGRPLDRSLPQALQSAILTMRQSADAPVSLDEIAAAAAVSLRTLDRLFQSTLGTSAGRYYRMIRLSHARSLAMETRLPLSAIATRTGFSSAATLARAYRRHYGTTIGRTRRS